MDMTAQKVLFEAVAAYASEMNAITENWMLFGGAAMALHGLQSPLVDDIDILAPMDAAQRFSERHMLRNRAASGSERFRSKILLRADFTAIPAEIMAGFEVLNQGIWVPVDLVGYQRISILGEPVNLASRSRLKEIFELCAREKDLLRAERL